MSIAGAAMQGKSARLSLYVGCQGKQVVLIVVYEVTLVMEEEHPFVTFSSPNTAPLPKQLRNCHAIALPGSRRRQSRKAMSARPTSSVLQQRRKPRRRASQFPDPAAQSEGNGIRRVARQSRFTCQSDNMRRSSDRSLGSPRLGTAPHWRNRTCPNSLAA